MNHSKKIQILQKTLLEYKEDPRPIKFIRTNTNSTRTIERTDEFIYLDTSNLNEILEVDIKNKIVKAEPGVTMRELVTSTLKHNLLPKVVPEFPSITIGGAYQGAALESSSFKYGQVSDTVNSIEVLDAQGNVNIISPKTNPDLFYGMSGSYGSLALTTQLNVELIKATKSVNLFIFPIDTPNLDKELREYIHSNKYDYIEGLVFSKEKSVIVCASFTENPVPTKISFYREEDEWFYKFVKDNSDSAKEFSCETMDYLFRYDYGAFWMGEYFFTDIAHIPNFKFVRNTLHKFMNTRILYEGMHQTNISHRFFIQDFYVGIEKMNSAIKYFIDKTNIFPIWICPIKPINNEQFLSPHYIDSEIVVDVGVWGMVPHNHDAVRFNRRIELEVYRQGGRQMLYADMYLNEKEFWKYYDKKKYNHLKSKYDPKYKFSDVWNKTRSKKDDNTEKLILGMWRTFMNKLRGKI